MLDVAAAVVAGYLALVALVFLGRGALIYPGTWLRAGETTSIAGAERWEHRFGPGADEVVPAFFIPPAPSARPAPAVVHFHGNGEIAGDRRDLIDFYRARGFAVLLVEYRGYGGAGGSPGFGPIADDMAAKIGRLAAHPAVDPARIVLHGTSLGGAFATEAARRRPPRALILESAFTSIAAIAWRRGLPGSLLGTDYDVGLRLPEIAAASFIVHGTADPVVPFDMGPALAGLAQRATFVAIEGEDHVLTLTDRRFADPLAAFLDREVGRAR